MWDEKQMALPTHLQSKDSDKKDSVNFYIMKGEIPPPHSLL